MRTSRDTSQDSRCTAGLSRGFTEPRGSESSCCHLDGMSHKVIRYRMSKNLQTTPGDHTPLVKYWFLAIFVITDQRTPLNILSGSPGVVFKFRMRTRWEPIKQAILILTPVGETCLAGVLTLWASAASYGTTSLKGMQHKIWCIWWLVMGTTLSKTERYCLEVSPKALSNMAFIGQSISPDCWAIHIFSWGSGPPAGITKEMDISPLGGSLSTAWANKLQGILHLETCIGHRGRPGCERNLPNPRILMQKWQNWGMLPRGSSTFLRICRMRNSFWLGHRSRTCCKPLAARSAFRAFGNWDELTIYNYIYILYVYYNEINFRESDRKWWLNPYRS